MKLGHPIKLTKQKLMNRFQHATERVSKSTQNKTVLDEVIQEDS